MSYHGSLVVYPSVRKQLRPHHIKLTPQGIATGPPKHVVFLPIECRVGGTPEGITISTQVVPNWSKMAPIYAKLDPASNCDWPPQHSDIHNLSPNLQQLRLAAKGGCPQAIATTPEQANRARNCDKPATGECAQAIATTL